MHKLEFIAKKPVKLHLIPPPVPLILWWSACVMKGIISVSALLLKKYRKSSKGRGNPPVVSLQKWEKGRGYLLELFQSYSVMRAPAKTAVQRLKEANRGFKMTVTEMNVCFEAALLQCTKAGRMLLVLASPQGRSCSYHQWKSGSMKCHVKVKLVLSQSLNTLCSHKSCCVLWPQPLKGPVKWRAVTAEAGEEAGPHAGAGGSSLPACLEEQLGLLPQSLETGSTCGTRRF